MNRLTCLVVDDEPIARKGIREFVDKIPHLEFKGYARDIDELMLLLSTEPVDLLFLDIEMPGLSGLDFVKSYENSLPMVIFITAYHDHAVESYNLHAVDYLLKPVSFERFLDSSNRAIEVAESRSLATQQDSFFLRHEGRFQRVRYSEVVYVSAMQNYTRIHLSSGNQLIVRYTMKTIMDYLQPSSFLMVHKSYIVNESFVDSVSSTSINLSGFGQVPVGRRYKDDVVKRLVSNS